MSARRKETIIGGAVRLTHVVKGGGERDLKVKEGENVGKRVG